MVVSSASKSQQPAQLGHETHDPDLHELQAEPPSHDAQPAMAVELAVRTLQDQASNRMKNIRNMGIPLSV